MGRPWGIETMSAQLKAAIDQENRRILGEAAVTLLVGMGTCILVFGVVFWLSWFVFTMFFRNFQIGSATTTALIITGIFALVSIFSAWRKHDPFENVQAMDGKVQSLQLGLGYAMGVPIVNRQSAAGIASLLIGGPANIMDAIGLWRRRLHAGPELLASAGQVLRESRQGISPQMVKDQRAIVLLHRLGLVKSSHEQGKLQIIATLKGADLIGK
jgi:hypothetical protein